MKIRRVSPEDASKFRELRLQALKDAPEAFGMSYEEYLPKTVDDAAKMLSESTGIILACESEDRFIGMAGLAPERGIKRRHIALIWGVYLDPAYRGGQVATELMEHLIAEARALGTVSILHLAVGATNPRALKFYERMGFKPWGTEKRALNVNGKFIDEIHMAREL